MSPLSQSSLEALSGTAYFVNYHRAAKRVGQPLGIGRGAELEHLLPMCTCFKDLRSNLFYGANTYTTEHILSPGVG